MASDASIYGLMKEQKPLPGPVDQFGQLLNLKGLMTQNRVHELQGQQLEQNMAEEQGVKDYLRSLSPDQEADTTRLTSISPKFGTQYQSTILKNKETQGKIAHTAAQTGDITAGHIAGAMAALAKGDGSDESVRQAHDIMVQAGVPEAQASQTTARVLSVPQPLRLAYVTAQAGQHKVGQEALKLFFPQAHMQDTGGEVTPVSTSTLPGGLAPGTPIPGAAPIQKTQSPDSAATDARVAEEGRLNRAQHLQVAQMTDARQRELNGIMEGQTNEPSPELVKSIASGEIELKPPPTNARNPIMLQRYGQMLEKVKAANPNWSQEMYPTIKKTVAAFATGKEGATVKALNTATDHLETLRELVAAQKNGNVQLFNRIANQYASNTGNPAPSNLAVAAQVVGGEIVKGIVGAGGGVGEREKAEAAFSNIKSPADAEGAINTVTKLMGGQFKGMQKQYEAGTYGRKDFAEKYLSPAAQKALEAAQGKPKEVAPGDQVKAPKGKLAQPVKFLGFE